MPRLLLGMLVWAVASGGGGTPPAHPCEACHRDIVATFRETAHFRTSADASARSIKGQFAAGRSVAGAARYSRDYVLGISCEKCHGDGSAHVRYQVSHPTETSGRYILNPARFSRDRKVDTCALCHAGERDPKVPPFSYRPGDKLDDYFAPPANAAATADVHGNQVALLQRTKCFRSSPGMSCSPCHDVHRPLRDVTAFADKIQ